MKTNKTSDSCYADFSSLNINPKLDQNKESNMLNVVSFAPFLMWNNHDNNYFKNVGKINNMAINENNIYETPKSCNNDDNYADLMKEAFFSLENMDIIQNRIIISVYLKSNKTLRVNKIKNETLIQVMNHIWTNFCRFLPYDLKEQIDELDNKVTEYIAPLLLKESQFYFNYLRDSDRTNLPQLDRPIMINKDRKQQLPSFYK
jgi:hypothetical protein